MKQIYFKISQNYKINLFKLPKKDEIYLFLNYIKALNQSILNYLKTIKLIYFKLLKKYESNLFLNYTKV